MTTAITEVVAKSMADILAVNTRVEEMLEEAKKTRLAAVEPFLEALAASGEVSLILIRGYTPGFNDGEPCEHSADFQVNLKQATEEEWIGPDSDGDFNVGLDDEFWEVFREERRYDSTVGRYVDDPGAAQANRELCAKFGHVYDRPKQEIINAIDTLIFTTEDEQMGTDYWVSYTLKDGKFVREDGDYDCGY